MPVINGAASLEGRRLAGGKTSCEALTRLFGLDGTPFPVKKVGWLDHHLEVAVDLGQGQEAVFSLERKQAGTNAYLLTETLAVYYRGENIPVAMDNAVRKLAPARLADFTIEKLAELMAGDPQLGEPGLALPPDVNAQKRPSNQLDTWGSDDAYAEFFAGGEISRGQLDSIDPGKLFHMVQHCDNECLLVTPHSIAPLIQMVDYPWDDRVRNIGAQRVEQLFNILDEDGADNMVTTELDEQDVIRGNPGKLRAVLDYVTTRPGAGSKIVFFSNTCVPTMTGEDVESVVRQYQRDTKVPILYLTVTPRSMVSVFHDLLVERRVEAERATEHPDFHAVNLIGYPEARAVNEARDMLSRFGVRVNTQLLPQLDLERVLALPQAALNVFLPNGLWQHLYDQLLFDSRIPHISPTPPYGLEGSRRWCKAIVEALEVDTDFDHEWEKYLAEHREAWQRVTARAASHRLGFVVRAEEVYYLTDPSRTWGVPLVELFEEAGFGLDVFLKVHDRTTAQKTAGAIHSLFGRPEAHRIKGFNSFDMLEQRLAASPCEAVFSHHFFDWRVSSAGKNRFTLQHMEMGLPGTLRTLERLVGICETPFFRRYQRYLARTAEGLRAPTTTPAEVPVTQEAQE
jgi:hypothetical protein